MLPVDTRVWAHRIPGHIPDSDEEDSEDEEFVTACEERLDVVRGTLGPKLIETPIVEFSPVSFHQRGSATLKTTPPASSFTGGRLPSPCFKIERVHAPIVTKTFCGNGLSQTSSNNWTVQWCGAGMRDSGYQNLNEFQRLNHFPGSTELTRKDRLWKHFNEMKQAFGADSFDFVPESYVIPDQVEQFLDCYEKTNHTWIVKPNASSQGKGIFLLHDLEDLPLTECSVISRYIENPMLIQGLKFDLRIYVLVTSYTPLRAYVYKEGLTRFASSPYNMDPSCLNDAYRHLTNYSVNKTALNFVENQEEELDNYGHKWSLSALNRHLKCVGIDINLMWARINDLIVKTLLSVEPSIAAKTRSLGAQNNCFECYGFDVLVDDQLKPWLLEVNLSPSMQADSPLDWKVKSSLLADAFNIVGVNCPSRETTAASRLRTRVMQARQTTINQAENSATSFGKRGSVSEGRPDTAAKQRPDTAAKQRPDTAALKPPAPLGRKAVDLDRLAEEQLRSVAMALKEQTRCRNFIRLYPTRTTCERYLPIWDYRGPRSESSTTFRIAQALSTRLLASVLFGPPPVGAAVGERRLTRLRFSLGGNNDFEAPSSPQEHLMKTLDSETTKAPSDDCRSDADNSDIESRDNEHMRPAFLHHLWDDVQETSSPPELGSRHAFSAGTVGERSGGSYAGDAYGVSNAGFRPPPLPRPQPPEGASEGARAAARNTVQHPRSPPPRHLHHRSKSTPVLPKLTPDTLQAMRCRENSSQWMQIEPLLHEATKSPLSVKIRRGHQLLLDALAANHSVEIEL